MSETERGDGRIMQSIAHYLAPGYQDRRTGLTGLMDK